MLLVLRGLVQVVGVLLGLVIWPGVTLDIFSSSSFHMQIIIKFYKFYLFWLFVLSLLLIPMGWIRYFSLLLWVNCLSPNNPTRRMMLLDIFILFLSHIIDLSLFPALFPLFTNALYHLPFLKKTFLSFSPWSHHTIFLLCFFLTELLRKLSVPIFSSYFFLKPISTPTQPRKLLLTGSPVTFTFQIQWSFFCPHFSGLIISIWHDWSLAFLWEPPQPFLCLFVSCRPSVRLHCSFQPTLQPLKLWSQGSVFGTFY